MYDVNNRDVNNRECMYIVDTIGIGIVYHGYEI